MNFKTLYFFLFSFFFFESPEIQAQEKVLTTSESAEILSKYIQFESTSGNEKEAGSYFSSVCHEKGLFVSIFNDESDSYNFAASLYPLSSGKPNIVLLNHIDIVPEGALSQWETDPYGGEIKNGAVCGRGAIDAKGLGVMQASAIFNFIELAKKENLPYNVTLLAVSGEETGGENGAKRVIAEHLKELNPIVVFGEGGSGIEWLSGAASSLFGISIAEKSNLWLKLEANKCSGGHGSAPPDVYANKSLVKALSKITLQERKIHFDYTVKNSFAHLSKTEKGFRKFAYNHLHWNIFKPALRKQLKKEPYLKTLFSNTIAITNIQNPAGSHNQISGEACAYLDCRLLPEQNPDEFIAFLKSTINDPDICISIVRAGKASDKSELNEFYYAMEKAISLTYDSCIIVPVLFPATTDNSYFRAEGITTYGIMPVMLSKEELESVHGPNEKLPLELLEKGIETYSKLISNVLESRNEGMKMKKN